MSRLRVKLPELVVAKVSAESDGRDAPAAAPRHAVSAPDESKWEKFPVIYFDLEQACASLPGSPSSSLRRRQGSFDIRSQASSCASTTMRAFASSLAEALDAPHLPGAPPAGYLAPSNEPARQRSSAEQRRSAPASATSLRSNLCAASSGCPTAASGTPMCSDPEDTTSASLPASDADPSRPSNSAALAKVLAAAKRGASTQLSTSSDDYPVSTSDYVSSASADKLAAAVCDPLLATEMGPGDIDVSLARIFAGVDCSIADAAPVLQRTNHNPMMACHERMQELKVCTVRALLSATGKP